MRHPGVVDVKDHHHIGRFPSQSFRVGLAHDALHSQAAHKERQEDSEPETRATPHGS